MSRSCHGRETAMSRSMRRFESEFRLVCAEKHHHRQISEVHLIIAIYLQAGQIGELGFILPLTPNVSSWPTNLVFRLAALL